ncbi:MAG TPA: MFS transporter [Nitrospiraceae bacterium]|nr:MFS transporter [Nitrospiraceae bacterium]
MRSTLDGFFSFPKDLLIDPEVARHFRRNFIVNAGDGMAWLLGTSFFSVATILPVYASRLTDSAVLIGMIPALTDVGWYLPQLFMSRRVERLRRTLPTVALLGGLERLPYLILPAVALWIDRLPGQGAIVVFLILVAWMGLAGGLVATPWQELIARIIPTSRRGVFFGTSFLGGHLVGVGGASIAALVLATIAYPFNYATCFSLGSLGVLISYSCMLMTKEPPRRRNAAPGESLGDYVRRLWGILGSATNFRSYLVSRSLSYLGNMAYGFMAVYAVQQFALGDAQAAVFTAIMLAGGIAGYAVWGPLGDRLGHKRVMQMAGSFMLVALALALWAKVPQPFTIIFGLLGFSRAGTLVADLAIAMEFGPEDERPTYVGLARTVTSPAVFVAPIAGGAIIAWAGYSAMFVIALGLSAAGLCLLSFRVQEPRHLLGGGAQATNAPS